MLVNQNEIACDECQRRIEPCPKLLAGWDNLSTAEAHVCEGCWEKEIARTLNGVKSWEDVNIAIKKIRFPVRTFIGCVEDSVIERVMEKYGTVS